MPTSRTLGHRLVPVLAALASLAAASGCVIDYQLRSSPQTATVRVAAGRAWTDTGVDVQPGEQLTIDYVDGLWSPWPGGSYDAIGSGGDPRCDCNRILGVSHAALIGRLGEGEPFLVGDHWDAVVGEGGRLFLGMNDTRLGDNSGWIEVRIRAGS